MRSFAKSHPLRRQEKCREPRGAATVEFALVLPLLAFLFVLTVDFGRYFHVSTVITQCARNGAIYLSQPEVADSMPYDSLKEAALADASNLTEQATVSSSSGTDELGLPYIEVTVDYPFQTVSNFPGIPSGLQIVRKARMRVVTEDP